MIFPVHSFPVLINSALSVLDGLCQKPTRRPVKPVAVPSYIEKNLLSNQRILFVSTREKLSLIAHLALAVSAKSINRDAFFNGAIDELGWNGVSEAVKNLRVSVQSIGLEVSGEEIENISAQIDTGLVPPVDVVIIDASLPFVEELEGYFKMNAGRFANDQGKYGVFIRNFLRYSDFIA